jgi:hypothetical protein
MTVCFLVRHVRSLNGHVVSVRGVIIGADDYPLEYLVDDCPSTGIRGSKKLRIRIFYPDEEYIYKRAPKGFRWDATSLSRFGKLVERAKAQGKQTDHFVVTVTGVAYDSSPSSPSSEFSVKEGSPGDASLLVGGMYDIKVLAK